MGLDVCELGDDIVTDQGVEATPWETHGMLTCGVDDLGRLCITECQFLKPADGGHVVEARWPVAIAAMAPQSEWPQMTISTVTRIAATGHTFDRA